MKMNLLVAIMMCGGAPAVKADQAPSPVPTIDPGKINRHFGFFIRPELGVGYATGSETFPQGDLQVTGLAGSAGVNLGGAVVEDTILGVHFYDVVLSNPTVSVGNQTASTTDTSYSLFAIGPSAIEA